MPQPLSNNKSEFTGRRVLIAGSGGGIGRALAQAFADAGAQLILFDRDRKGVESQAAELTEGHEQQNQKESRTAARGFACDLSSAGQIRHAFTQAFPAQAAQDDGLDILIYNAAAFSDSKPFYKISEQEWNAALAVNLTGAFLTAKEAIPHLQCSGVAVILLIASQLAHVASAGQAAYCSSKGALLQLTKVMAADLAEFGIRVVSLSPGGTATSRLERRFDSLENAQAVLGSKHLLKRLADPTEIARTALFLCSRGAGFITGSDMLVDGGYTAV